VLARRAEQLHLVDPDLDADVVAGARFAEAGTDAVELCEDGLSVVQPSLPVGRRPGAVAYPRMSDSLVPEAPYIE
jgi:hypothetical protein